MNPVRRHLIYRYLLTDCLSLSTSHRKDLEKIYGEAPDLVRSLPSATAHAIILPLIAEMFDFNLQGVPGFYFARGLTPRDAIAREVGIKALSDKEYAWRLNLPKREGLLRPYLNEDELIIGLYIYNHAGDANPRLLSSQKLCLGTEAAQPIETTDRSIAA